ncbi:MAG: DsbA family oxidoreductase [bacterium]|nr:DsbA family oxidoreductase [bacterium]
MRIDVFHDTACPWCRVGKANLKRALAQWDGDPVTVEYHTFFLNADIPAEGYDFRAYMTAKGGGQVPLEQWFAAPREAGRRAGITFNFETITRAPNTLLSHRLIALTPEPHREAMIDALYAAYFEHGRDIGDLDVLVETAVAVGLEGEDIRQQLLSDAKEAEVLGEAEQAHRLGITGVPFFVFNNTYAFSGAQPPEIFLRAMRQAAEFQRS